MISKKEITLLRAALIGGMRNFFSEMGYVETFPPGLSAGPGSCENIKAIFKLPYFGRIAYLAQTSQLYLEAYLADMSIEKVFSVIKSYRAEEKVDNRRLTEFSLFEFESRDTSLDQLIDTIEQSLRRVFGIEGVRIRLHPNAIKAIEKQVWSRITYSDAILIIQRSKPNFKWGQDFSEEEEALITREYGISFVTHYPTRIKFFNMKLSRKNENVVEACDVLLPVAGEAVGGSVRETNANIIERRLNNSPILTELAGVRAEDFYWYLNLFREREIERAGAGIGIERVIQFILQEQDIHNCIEFPRDANLLVP